MLLSFVCLNRIRHFFSLRASPLRLGSTGTAPRDAIGCDGRIPASRMRAMGLGSAPTRHSPSERRRVTRVSLERGIFTYLLVSLEREPSRWGWSR